MQAQSGHENLSRFTIIIYVVGEAQSHHVSACEVIQNCKTDRAKKLARKLPFIYSPGPPKMLSGFSFNVMVMNIITFQYEPACRALEQVPKPQRLYTGFCQPYSTSNVAHTVRCIYSD